MENCIDCDSVIVNVILLSFITGFIIGLLSVLFSRHNSSYKVNRSVEVNKNETTITAFIPSTCSTFTDPNSIDEALLFGNAWIQKIKQINNSTRDS